MTTTDRAVVIVPSTAPAPHRERRPQQVAKRLPAAVPAPE
jgi:hypothetical protein